MMRKINFPYIKYGKTKNLDPGTEIDRYQIIKMVGFGEFGSVFNALDLAQNRQVALKIVDIECQRKKRKEPEIVKLIQLSTNQPLNLMKIDSQYVVKCYDGFQNQEQNLKFLVMEYCNGPTLQKYIVDLKEKKQILQDYQAFEIFLDISKGVKELHRKNMMHRDLHSKNIIKNGSRWVVVDLGLSKLVREREFCQEGTFLGAKVIQAPEMIKQGKYGFKVDIWALGLNLFYLLTSRYLFFGKEIKNLTPQKILKLIQKRLQIEFGTIKNEGESSILKDCKVPEKMIELLKDILKFNPSERMTITQLFNHPIFIEYRQKIQKNKNFQNQEPTTEMVSESSMETTYEQQCSDLLQNQ